MRFALIENELRTHQAVRNLVAPSPSSARAVPLRASRPWPLRFGPTVRRPISNRSLVGAVMT